VTTHAQDFADVVTGAHRFQDTFTPPTKERIMKDVELIDQAFSVGPDDSVTRREWLAGFGSL
jgi:hypothetical protein